MPSNLLVVSIFLFLTLLFLSSLCECRADRSHVKGMFVFGSSLVDNGNNNFITLSTVKANYPPYGIDSPLGATGRFSNGKNMVDVLGELLDLPSLLPPFNDPDTKGAKIVNGVNYASGGSGILDQTGFITGVVINLNQQIKNFEQTTLPDLESQIGRNQRLSGHLCEYLFMLGTGGNDYLLNYFMPATGMSKLYNLMEFTTMLISTLSGQLKRLYDLGARKFVVFSVQPLGCEPVVRAALQITNGSCVESINQAALLFNSQLRSLACNTEAHMPGSHMVYVDSYNIIRDIIENPIHNGFSDTINPCCELASIIGSLCRRGGSACADRRAHVFFDGIHPTDAVNARIAGKAYNSNSGAEVYPINVKQLAQLSGHALL